MAESKLDRYTNYDIVIGKGELTIRVCTDESMVDVQPSKSGRTMVIATTGGASRIPGTPYRLNLTVYRSP